MKGKSMAFQLTCQHCGESITVQDEWIDSGIVIHCSHCNNDTIIDLFKPEERTKLYGFGSKGQ